MGKFLQLNKAPRLEIRGNKLGINGFIYHFTLWLISIINGQGIRNILTEGQRFAAYSKIWPFTL